jgi:enoyl-CoA hydratase/carnithine racemase
MPSVIVGRRDQILHMGLNRPAKQNAFNIEMLEELGRVYGGSEAVEPAERIATRSAPLSVGTTLAAAQRANRDGEGAAEDRFVDDVDNVVALIKTMDGGEGMLSFLRRRAGRFIGAWAGNRTCR